jgi:hypothetical protein
MDGVEREFMGARKRERERERERKRKREIEREREREREKERERRIKLFVHARESCSPTLNIQERDSPIFLQFFYLFSIFFLNRI